MRPATLILGLGNPLRGDDGVGPRVVEELNRRGLPDGVIAVDGGTGGLDLFRLLERRKRVVIVDAADLGREPGQFARLTRDQMRLVMSDQRFSLHHAGLGEVLDLADALELALPEMVIFGVQPAEINWGEGLTPAVEAAVPALTDALFEEIEGDNDAQDLGN
ncbi:MAG: hydrogenase maturation protease [Anaerolineae bacterium]|jgi:hydrogenase maturation protease